jgi:hypothetical protein
MEPKNMLLPPGLPWLGAFAKPKRPGGWPNIRRLIGRSTRADSGRFTAGQGTLSRGGPRPYPRREGRRVESPGCCSTHVRGPPPRSPIGLPAMDAARFFPS